MLVTAFAAAPPEIDNNFDTRINGPDCGLINAWLVGIHKRTSDPELAAKARAGELPPLPFRGGVQKAIKAQNKIGALAYLAAWHGLRGEDLHMHTDQETTLVCTRTGVPVTYTGDTQKIWAASATDGE
ncbi:hypothetical protein M2J84_05545 [Comamonas aquatica]|uniref:hypothetical protein n=1 Tax=Comamonas aquatica TaxID=225991 RepID=UPI0022DD7349|nr:hypothetical protein [Comamonas aquatica]WBM43100.1 hypothetical protein M2J84_05545 [Comamonas aquatica]